MQTEQTYSLDELCALVDMPKRTVRYYIQNGLLDRPEGLNRGAKYTRSHLERLLFIRKWQQAGLSLERIQELISSPEHDLPPVRRRGPGTVEVWSHLVVREGVELHVEPGQAGLSPEQLRAFLRQVTAAFESISKQSGDREEAP
ncbi:MAG: MerR family transcriptional regulator [Rhodocyclaceae bacterium]|nr:MerR family transcriptional regulator [Rhodocyclaceae bacterium]